MKIDTHILLSLAEKRGKLTTSELSEEFGVTRQYLARLLKELVVTEKLIRVGSTRYAFYVLPEYAAKHSEIFPHRYIKTFQNVRLEEHKVIDQVEQTLPCLGDLPENVKSIFTFAFSEMLNNAIEHSQSEKITIEASVEDDVLTFTINDFGVGAFRNIMKKRNLKSELEAIQDLLKGKTTTMPKSHSGEGIFFTSKAGDRFVLDSYGYQLIVDNTIPDIFVKEVARKKEGTKVTFTVQTQSKLHLNTLFKKYTNLTDESDYGFDKTDVHIKLYTIGGVYVSRSQARRVLTGLDKFKIVTFDFDKVPMVGQAFADEIFRVFHNKYPHIKLQTLHMEEGVRFMIERAQNEALKRS